MKTCDKKTLDMILKHKQHFDERLIQIAQNQYTEIEKMKEQSQLHEASLNHQKEIISCLELKVRDARTVIDCFRIQLGMDRRKSSCTIEEIEKAVNDLTREVEDELKKSYRQNQELLEEIQRLKKENETLRKKKKRNLNSTNSSRPSSTDGYFIRPNSRTRSQLKRGGQKGHAAHRSRLTDEVSKIIDIEVTEAPKGAEAVRGAEGGIRYYRTQEIDLEMRTAVIETRYHIRKEGRELTREEKEKYAVNSVTYSRRFKSNVLYLNHRGVIGMQRLCEMLEEMSGGKIHVRPSTIVKWTKEFSDRSGESCRKIMKDILEGACIHTDETGNKTSGKNAWTHVMTNERGAVFKTTEKRKDTEEGPIGKLQGYRGVVVHDHYKPYYELECRHAECNAHILRYLQAGADHYGSEGCREMIGLLREMQHEKKERIKKGQSCFEGNGIEAYERKYLEIARRTIEQYEKENPGIRKKYEAEYIKTMRRMIIYRNEHLLFIRDFRVPFDNNAAERQIRFVKTKRKISYQHYSQETADQYARVMTILQTCRIRKENTLKKIEDILS